MLAAGSLDGQARLVVKGRFLPKVFEGILRRYINEYVICNMCKSADTLLHKCALSFHALARRIPAINPCNSLNPEKFLLCNFLTLPGVSPGRTGSISCAARPAARRGLLLPSRQASWRRLGAASKPPVKSSTERSKICNRFRCFFLASRCRGGRRCSGLVVPQIDDRSETRLDFVVVIRGNNTNTI